MIGARCTSPASGAAIGGNGDDVVRGNIMVARAWLDSEIFALRECLQLDTDADAPSCLGRSSRDVKRKRIELGLAQGRVLDELRRQAEAETETERRNRHEVVKHG
jgi:hypothetical protein